MFSLGTIDVDAGFSKDFYVRKSNGRFIDKIDEEVAAQLSNWLLSSDRQPNYVLPGGIVFYAQPSGQFVIRYFGEAAPLAEIDAETGKRFATWLRFAADAVLPEFHG